MRQQYFCIEQLGRAPECRENECFVDNGGCGSRDQLRCVDRPDIDGGLRCEDRRDQRKEAALFAAQRSGGRLHPPQVPTGVFRLSTGRYTQIASTPTYVCGLEAAGSVRCGAAPESSVPAGTDFTAISGGAYHRAPYAVTGPWPAGAKSATAVYRVPTCRDRRASGVGRHFYDLHRAERGHDRLLRNRDVGRGERSQSGRRHGLRVDLCRARQCLRAAHERQRRVLGRRLGAAN